MGSEKGPGPGLGRLLKFGLIWEFRVGWVRSKWRGHGAGYPGVEGEASGLSIPSQAGSSQAAGP